MRKLTHSESEIVGAVKELEAGGPANTVCHRLNVIDDFGRYALGQLADYSITGRNVTEFLDNLALDHGKPAEVRCDNGQRIHFEGAGGMGVGERGRHRPHPARKAHAERRLLERIEQKVEIVHIQPGKPMQNGYVERFNGTHRRAVLDAVLFRRPAEVHRITDEWRKGYNLFRPHEALGDMMPEEFYRNGLKAAGLREESKGKAARPPPSPIPHGRKVAGKAEALKMN